MANEFDNGLAAEHRRVEDAIDFVSCQLADMLDAATGLIGSLRTEVAHLTAQNKRLTGALVLVDEFLESLKTRELHNENDAYAIDDIVRAVLGDE